MIGVAGGVTQISVLDIVVVNRGAGSYCVSVMCWPSNTLVNWSGSRYRQFRSLA